MPDFLVNLRRQNAKFGSARTRAQGEDCSSVSRGHDHHGAFPSVWCFILDYWERTVGASERRRVTPTKENCKGQQLAKHGHKPIEIKWQEFEALCAIQATLKEIAAVFGCSPLVPQRLIQFRGYRSLALSPHGTAASIRPALAAAGRNRASKPCERLRQPCGQTSACCPAPMPSGATG